MPLDIQQSGQPLGHLIRNLDVRNVSDETMSEIEALYRATGVIVIRDQKLSPDDLIGFSRRFGSLDRFVVERFNHPQYPEILVLSNIVEDGHPIGYADAGAYWHSDMWISERPPRGSILYGIQIPHNGDQPLGDTLFASTAHAYDTLSEDMKARIEDLSAVFSSRKYAEYIGLTTVKDVYTRDIVAARQDIKDKEITHRLVRRHPYTGRKCLYVVEGAISHIAGMEQGASDKLLEELLQHVIRPEVVYRHRWQAGDIVLWDNYSTLHRATGDYKPPQWRLMHRTTLSAPLSAVA